MSHLSAWSAAHVVQPVNPGIAHVLLWLVLNPHAAVQVLRRRTVRTR